MGPTYGKLSVSAGMQSPGSGAQPRQGQCRNMSAILGVLFGLVTSVPTWSSMFGESDVQQQQTYYSCAAPSGRPLHFVSELGGILGPDESLHQECTPEDGAPPFKTGRARHAGTDASEVPDCECSRYLVVAVFDSPRCPDLFWTALVIPKMFVPTWVC